MKRLFILTFALFLIVAAIYGVSKTSAQTANPGSQTIIERIAQKFGLNQADVQSVFNDYRSEKMKTLIADRRSRLEQQLTTSVTNGNITEAQKQAILNKYDELSAKKTQDMTDLQNWVKQNGLDKVGMGLGFGFGKFGMGRGMHFWR